MNITITGRNIKVSQNQKEHVEKKIGKLENHFNQLLNAHVILYVEKLDHAAEVIINGDGVQFHGREKAADLFSAIDLLIDKMEKQIVKYKEKHQQHKGVRHGDLPVAMPLEFDGVDLDLNQASNKPIDRVEAYLEMKLEKKDFILFKMGVTEIDSGIDYSNKNYAVMYKDGSDIRLVEIPFEAIREHHFHCEKFLEYQLDIQDDSPANPRIEFKPAAECHIEQQTIIEALERATAQDAAVYPFFNVESQYFNVVFKNGKNYDVMVPAY